MESQKIIDFLMSEFKPTSIWSYDDIVADKYKVIILEFSGIHKTIRIVLDVISFIERPFETIKEMEKEIRLKLNAV